MTTKHQVGDRVWFEHNNRLCRGVIIKITYHDMLLVQGDGATRLINWHEILAPADWPWWAFWRRK